MRKSINIFIAVILAILPFLTLFIIVNYSSIHILYILPSEKFYSLGYFPYSDDQTSINSFYADSRKIGLEYILNGKKPEAGISINLATEFPLLDLSGYSVLRIKISSKKRTRFGAVIRTFEPGITEINKNDFAPVRQKENYSELIQGNNVITFNLKAFRDPDWWIAENAPGKSLDKNPFQYSCILQLFFDDINLVGQKNNVVLEEISFHLVPSAFWLVIFIVISVYFCVYISMLLILRSKMKKEDNKEKLLTAYKKIEKISYREKDTERIDNYIKDHYYDPNISLDSIVTATGLSRKRVTTLMQREYSMSLKECINWLRLQEAKRLLLETDLNITEIAFSLGYGSSSYFGVLFKNQEGVSPKEFRKKQLPGKKP